MVFGFIRSVVGAFGGARGEAPVSEVDQLALQLVDEMNAARLLARRPDYEEPADPSPEEIEQGTHNILDIEAARFLARSVSEPMNAVAWVLARSFGHRPVYLSAYNHIWHLGTLSPTYEQWLLLIWKERGVLTVKAADGTIHGRPMALASLRRLLQKADLGFPPALQP